MDCGTDAPSKYDEQIALDRRCADKLSPEHRNLRINQKRKESHGALRDRATRDG